MKLLTMGKVAPSLAVLLLSVCIQLCCGTRFTARIDQLGYEGTVTLETDDDQAMTTLTHSIQKKSTGTTETITSIEIYANPSVFGTKASSDLVCSPDRNLIGGSVHSFDAGSNGDFTGILTESIRHDLDPSSTQVQDQFINHKSVTITFTDGTYVCGTILPDVMTMLTYRAKFTGPTVFGEIDVRMKQTADYSETDTQGANVLYYIEIPSDTTSIFEVCFSTDCTSCPTVGPLHASFAVDSQNRNFFEAGITQSSAGFDPTGPMKTLIRRQGDSAVVQCVDTHQLMPKTATAAVSWDGATSYLTMTQQSPYDSTHLELEAYGPALDGENIHFQINTYPVSQRLSEGEDRCASNLIGEIFNPFSESSGTASLLGTSDQYPVGDLSGRQWEGANFAYSSSGDYDGNLPLFGPWSVIGRSLVIKRASDGTSLMCGNIWETGHSYTTAVANFYAAPVYGTMFFRQAANQPQEDTIVLIELAAMDGQGTSDHNYRVHQRAVADSDTGDCSTTDGSYDPSGVANSGVVLCSVNSDNPYLCELGDLSGRHSGIGTQATLRLDTASKYLYSDANLPLSGDNSILGRSIVMDGPNGDPSPYACATIEILQPVTVTSATTCAGNNTGSGYSLSITQNTEFEPAMITLNGAGHNVQILDSPHACTDNPITPTFNPFNPPTPSTFLTTTDQYPVGDLTAKSVVTSSYGFGSYEPSVPHDSNLPLFTHLSVAGRGVLVTDTADNTMKYDALVMDSGSGYVITAEVTITATADAASFGSVSLAQTMYEDSSPSLTHVTLLAGNDQPSESVTSDFAITQNPTVDQHSCSTTGALFDPYGVGAGGGHCSQQNPKACALGQLSVKHTTYMINGGRTFFNDVNLPLSGINTVLGRSITFARYDNTGNEISFCGNILPTNGDTYTLGYPSTAVSYDRPSFVLDVTLSLSTVHASRITILHNVAVPHTNTDGTCLYVMVHIAGGLTAAEESNLLTGTGMLFYGPGTDCTSWRGMEAVGLSVSDQPPPTTTTVPPTTTTVAPTTTTVAPTTSTIPPTTTIISSQQQETSGASSMLSSGVFMLLTASFICLMFDDIFHIVFY